MISTHAQRWAVLAMLRDRQAIRKVSKDPKVWTFMEPILADAIEDYRPDREDRQVGRIRALVEAMKGVGR